MTVATTEQTTSAEHERPGLWQRYGKAVVGLYLLAPALFVLIVFFLVPLIIVFGRSFDVAEGEGFFANYTALKDSDAFRKIMRITFEIAVTTTVLCLFIGYLFAYRLSMMPRNRANLFLLISLVPFWTAILARLYAWTIILGRRGVLNDWFGYVGLGPFEDLLFSRKSVIIGMVHVMVPYMIIILYSTMISIDRTLLDASRSLGAGGFQTFRRVFLPMTMPGVYAGSLLVFIISLGFYITPAILGGGGDTTISMFISEKTRIGDWGVATAMGAVLLGVTIFLFFLFNKVFGTERLITGAIRK